MTNTTTGTPPSHDRKFIDAAGPLPVHLHADDTTARRLEAAPHGKTEAWHVLDAAPGATALCGVREGVDVDQLRAALLEQDFDAVMCRLPVRAGETMYVRGGTLHNFGPDTLVYEIEQTSDVQQHAMRWRMQDGATLSDQQWRANIEALLDEWNPAPHPQFRPGLAVPLTDGVVRVVLCAGPYFALERWAIAAANTARIAVDTATVLSNVGAPARLHACDDATDSPNDHKQTLGRARTVLLPAAMGSVDIEGPADVLAGYRPDLKTDIRVPLHAAGHSSAAIAALGEGIDDSVHHL